ncbi:hypothetical protein [Runella sp. SP2]|nr:hypothetical protein [Runella sp. SP2]
MNKTRSDDSQTVSMIAQSDYRLTAYNGQTVVCQDHNHSKEQSDYRLTAY